MKFTSQIRMFEHIWNTREHISELSGLPLLNRQHPQWHWMFAHILPKGTYPHYKFNPDNIILCLPEEHARQEEFPKFIERRDELKREYYKKYYNKKY